MNGNSYSACTCIKVISYQRSLPAFIKPAAAVQGTGRDRPAAPGVAGMLCATVPGNLLWQAPGP